MDIVSPSASGTSLTRENSLELKGTVSGPNAISGIEWTNGPRLHGAAILTNAGGVGGNGALWDAGSVPLVPGANQIRVIATDRTGRRTATSLSVIRPDPALPDPETKTGFWRGNRVTYTVVNGLPVTQGDIILDHVTAPEVAPSRERVPLAVSEEQKKPLSDGIVHEPPSRTMYSSI